MTHVFTNDSVKPGHLPRDYWTAADEELLLKRMGFADTVMVGAVRMVSQVARGGVTRRLTLGFQPDELLYGTVEGGIDGELTLRPEPGSEEFRRAVRLQHHLAGTHYLLFLKRSPDGGMRWALYRPNPRLLNEVRSRYAALRQHQVSTDG